MTPGAIVLPHFDEFFAHLGRLARFGIPDGAYLLGIDRMTGLVVGAGGWRVLGERRVVIELDRRREEYRAGDGG